jgi:hypothetical protein
MTHNRDDAAVLNRRLAMTQTVMTRLFSIGDSPSGQNRATAVSFKMDL